MAKKWMMVVGNNLAVYGLPGNHAYSLMNTATLSDGTKLVKLRNPWGTEQYTGPYSDSQLTAAQIQELDHVIGDDGVFWIDMNTFFLVMNWSNIAMYENWNTSKLDATWNRSNSNLNNWNYVNSQTQDVVIGIETYGQKQFANTRTCNTPEMPDQVIFSLKDTSGNYVYDRYGDYWNGVNTQLGNGYL